jgi:beta-aspartyl-peptidase (threonine type)
MEHTTFSLQEACDYVIHTKNGEIEGDMGLIAVNQAGNIGIAFNSEVMHRAWISSDEPLQVHIYPTDGQGKK